MPLMNARFGKSILLLFLLAELFGPQLFGAEALKDGDIVFHTSTSSQSRAIQAATHSRYTHMGIIYWQGGHCYVFEAVQPVKLTPVDRWINRGLNRHYVVKRLKEEKLLTPYVLGKMRLEAQRYMGKDYDSYFEWSDDRIYCSELVWKIYKRSLNLELGKVQQLKAFDLSNPVVREKLKERYGDKIPLDEKVISPEQIFRSSLLRTVLER